jgi:hypothetical protein
MQTYGSQSMQNQNGEVHVDTDEGRAGSTPHIVRYVLLICLGLAIALLSLAWISGAHSSDQAGQLGPPMQSENANVPAIPAERP